MTRLTPSPSWIEGSFQQTYEDWCKKKSLPVNIVTISEKTKGFWLGDPASPVILVFFHGTVKAHDLEVALN